MADMNEILPAHPFDIRYDLGTVLGRVGSQKLSTFGIFKSVYIILGDWGWGKKTMDFLYPFL